MRYLIDAQLPPGLAQWLSARGHACDHVNDIGLGSAADERIEAWARDRRAVIWSKDADFAERARQSSNLQVVWLRFGNTSNAALRTQLAPLVREIEAALEAGEVLIEVR